MTCFHPIRAFRSRTRSASGGYGITFNATKALIEGSSLHVPCGKCIGCRINRSKSWAVRCMHEAQLHKENCFVTLTFNNQNLPEDYSVHVEDVQKFVKRLRFKYRTKKIRTFAAGEYGDKDLRPHYHLLIFNWSPPDLKLFSTKNNQKLYTSQILQTLWPYGFSTVGSLTYQTAAYTARYVMKKVGGNMAAEHYLRIHPLTGKLNQVQPEFATQSNKPGIGAGWYDKFKTDIYPSDFVIVDGKKHPVPKYYINKLSEEEKKKNLRGRQASARIQRADNTPARLKVREEVLEDKLKVLKREI